MSNINDQIKSDYPKDFVRSKRRQLINSGLVLSWPESPSLDSPEI